MHYDDDDVLTAEVLMQQHNTECLDSQGQT